MNEWTADIDVDEHLAATLVVTQFPDLLPEDASLRLIGEGWDNALWQIERPGHAGPPVVVRIPRREIAVAGVQREIEALTLLAPLLPLPIPVPTHVGRPQSEFPWPFFAYELLDGIEITDAALGDDERMHLAQPLGKFLRALHAPSVLMTVDPNGSLPIDFNRRADMTRLAIRGDAAIRKAADIGLRKDTVETAIRVFASARDLPEDTNLVLVHGDLHLRHVLVRGDGTPGGVIDWGDLCRAPASVDLMIAFAVFAPPERKLLFKAYGPVGDLVLQRARALALYLCAKLAVYAHHESMEPLKHESLAGICRALA